MSRLYGECDNIFQLNAFRIFGFITDHFGSKYGYGSGLFFKTEQRWWKWRMNVWNLSVLISGTAHYDFHTLVFCHFYCLFRNLRISYQTSGCSSLIAELNFSVIQSQWHAGNEVWTLCTLGSVIQAGNCRETRNNRTRN